jgi:hypothetical protein
MESIPDARRAAANLYTSASFRATARSASIAASSDVRCASKALDSWARRHCSALFVHEEFTGEDKIQVNLVIDNEIAPNN